MPIDPGLDVHRIAAAARSILSCPQDVQLVVDGIDDLAGELNESGIEMQDHDGRPVLSCPAGSVLAMAATDHRGAVLTLSSGLGADGSPDRDARLCLSGSLQAMGMERCECCDEIRMRIGIDLDFVLLDRTNAPEGAPQETRVRVPIAAFISHRHDLNRGFLQRSAEHASQCHQDELRHAVSTLTHTRLGDVLGVQLTSLRADGVEVNWVDTSGAHRADLQFPRPATNTHELGDFLRAQLHSGIC